jgi:hypothetical protein
VSENRVLRKIFGPKREEVAGELNIAEKYTKKIFINLFFTRYYDDQIEKGEMGRLCNMHGKGQKYIPYSSWKA